MPTLWCATAYPNCFNSFLANDLHPNHDAFDFSHSQKQASALLSTTHILIMLIGNKYIGIIKEMLERWLMCKQRYNSDLNNAIGVDFSTYWSWFFDGRLFCLHYSDGGAFYGVQFEHNDNKHESNFDVYKHVEGGREIPNSEELNERLDVDNQLDSDDSDKQDDLDEETEGEVDSEEAEGEVDNKEADGEANDEEADGETDDEESDGETDSEEADGETDEESDDELDEESDEMTLDRYHLDNVKHPTQLGQFEHFSPSSNSSDNVSEDDQPHHSRILGSLSSCQKKESFKSMPMKLDSMEKTLELSCGLGNSPSSLILPSSLDQTTNSLSQFSSRTSQDSDHLESNEALDDLEDDATSSYASDIKSNPPSPSDLENTSIRSSRSRSATSRHSLPLGTHRVTRSSNTLSNATLRSATKSVRQSSRTISHSVDRYRTQSSISSRVESNATKHPATSSTIAPKRSLRPRVQSKIAFEGQPPLKLSPQILSPNVSLSAKSSLSSVDALLQPNHVHHRFHLFYYLPQHDPIYQAHFSALYDLIPLNSYYNQLYIPRLSIINHKLDRFNLHEVSETDMNIFNCPIHHEYPPLNHCNFDSKSEPSSLSLTKSIYKLEPPYGKTSMGDTHTACPTSYECKAKSEFSSHSNPNTNAPLPHSYASIMSLAINKTSLQSSEWKSRLSAYSASLIHELNLPTSTPSPWSSSKPATTAAYSHHFSTLFFVQDNAPLVDLMDNEDRKSVGRIRRRTTRISSASSQVQSLISSSGLHLNTTTNAVGSIRRDIGGHSNHVQLLSGSSSQQDVPSSTLSLNPKAISTRSNATILDRNSMECEKDADSDEYSTAISISELRDKMLPEAFDYPEGLRRAKDSELNRIEGSTEHQTSSTLISPSFPLHLGSIVVLNLGRIIYDREKFHSKRYIFPVGYCSKRIYFSLVEPTRRCWYTQEILEGRLSSTLSDRNKTSRGDSSISSTTTGSEPIFRLTCEDLPTEPIESLTPSGAWSEVLERIRPARETLAGKKLLSIVSGPEQFGLSHAVIHKLIQELPNAERCTQYDPFLSEQQGHKRPKKRNRSRTFQLQQEKTGEGIVDEC